MCDEYAIGKQWIIERIVKNMRWRSHFVRSEELVNKIRGWYIYTKDSYITNH